MKIIEIEWIDSVGVPPIWESKDAEPLVPSEACTVGYLCEDTPEYVIVAQSFTDSQFGRRFCIPRGCIKKIRVIRRK